MVSVSHRVERSRCHLPSTASITERAIGPARRPPAISLRAVLLDSTTHRDGDLAGRRPVRTRRTRRRAGDPPWTARCRSCRPTSTPEMRADVAVPLLDGAHHHRRELGGVGRAHGLAQPLGLGLLEDAQVGRAQGLDDVGPHHVAVVADAAGDHRHLQRRRGDLELADAGLGELRRLEVGALGGEAARVRTRGRPACRCRSRTCVAWAASSSWPILPAERAEGDVARDVERPLERDRGRRRSCRCRCWRACT